MRHERCGNVAPPVALRRDDQGAEQDDVGRPEQRENLVRQRADEEGRFGTEVVGECDENRTTPPPGRAGPSGSEQRQDFTGKERARNNRWYYAPALRRKHMAKLR